MERSWKWPHALSSLQQASHIRDRQALMNPGMLLPETANGSKITRSICFHQNLVNTSWPSKMGATRANTKCQLSVRMMLWRHVESNMRTATCPCPMLLKRVHNPAGCCIICGLRLVRRRPTQGEGISHDGTPLQCRLDSGGDSPTMNCEY